MDEHTLNDLLECSVCLERLTNPKVLPCQHTFCRKCLEVIVSSRQELRCPECRILVAVKIEELPPNVLLMRILEVVKSNGKGANSPPLPANEGQQGRQQPPQPSLQQQQQQQQHRHKTHQQLPQQAAVAQQQQHNHQQQQQIRHQSPTTIQQQQQQQQHHQHPPTQHLQQQSTQQHQHQSAQQQQQQQHKSRRCPLPHACALYDFDSSETSDLHFKKGDYILLKRRIDHNWYVGQLNGKDGTFPINYVQVIVPLPTTSQVSQVSPPTHQQQGHQQQQQAQSQQQAHPQCVALYDFRMGPNEEEGCLAFTKGQHIHVLRRVDVNWAEGRIASAIGIFPIAFVELNGLAKQLLDASTSSGASSQVSNAEAAPSTANLPAASAVDEATVTTTTIPPMPQVSEHHLTDQTPPPSALLSPSSSSSSSSGSAYQSTAAVASLTTSSSSTTPSSLANSPNALLTSGGTAATTAAANNATNSMCGVRSSGGSTSSSSSSTSASASASMASSPQQSQANTPQHQVHVHSGSASVRYRSEAARRGDKRHSLNAIFAAGLGLTTASTTTNSSGVTAGLSLMPPSNRHSAEILSVPSDCGPSPPTTTTTTGGGDNANEQQTEGTAYGSSQSPAGVTTAQPRANVLKTSGRDNVPPSLPWGYLALYPYKPRKADELELKKGCVYIVTERCLDGWFKGKNWQEIAGVFPGNYVTPLRTRDQQQLMHQWKFVPPPQQQQQQSTTAVAPQTSQPSSGGQPHPLAGYQMLPELPPRQMLPPTHNAAEASSSNSSITCHTLASVWTKPLGHTVEAFFNRHGGCTGRPAAITADPAQPQATKETSKPKEQGPASAAVSLMKRLTSMKSRSKSPAAPAAARESLPPPQQQQQQQRQAVLNNGGGGGAAASAGGGGGGGPQMQQLHSVHVRSGSCPSQLLQTLPHDLTGMNAAQRSEMMASQQQQQQHQAHQQQQQQQHQAHQQQQHRVQQQHRPVEHAGSQRQKSNNNKERPQLPRSGRQSMDGSLTVTNYSNMPLQCNPSANLKCAQQQQQQQHTHLVNPNHRKSHSFDANAIISPAAPHPNEVVGVCGGKVIIPPVSGAGNMTSAAILASATTKSAQNTQRESRFRCVVPYPPNSDIELELHVGDIIYVHRKQKNGWYKGTHSGTNKTGLFPASFVEPDP